MDQFRTIESSIIVWIFRGTLAYLAPLATSSASFARNAPALRFVRYCLFSMQGLLRGGNHRQPCWRVNTHCKSVVTRATEWLLRLYWNLQKGFWIWFANCVVYFQRVLHSNNIVVLVKWIFVAGGGDHMGAATRPTWISYPSEWWYWGWMQSSWSTFQSHKHDAWRSNR